MQRTHSRRRVLAALGLAATGGLAGCAEDEAGTPTATATPTATPAEGIPSYADFVPDRDEPVVFTMWDLEIEGGHRISTVPDEPTDPLRYGAVAGAYVEFLTGGFMQMMSYPFDASRVDTMNRERTLNVNGIAVQELPVELSGAVTDAEEASGPEIQFEAEDRAVIESDTGGLFGLTEDALVFPVVTGQSDTQQLVRDIVDTRAGAATPRHEADDGFAALLRAGDTTGSVACGHAPDTDLSEMVDEEPSFSVTLPTEGVESASGAVFRMDLDNGDPPQPASATIRYPEDTTVDTESLSSLGSAAQNRQLTQDDQTVRVTGEYSWDALSAFDGASDS